MDAIPSSSASEINGLRTIWESTLKSGSMMHGLRMPPERDGFETDEDFQVAYDRWFAAMHYWHATVKDVP